MSLNITFYDDLSQANWDLIDACSNNNVSRLRQALASGASPNINFFYYSGGLPFVLPEGFTPLSYCVFHNSKKCFAFLMSLQEIDVNVAMASMIWFMCLYNREDMLLDVLLRPELDLEHLGKCRFVFDKISTTPQERARKRGNEGIAQMIDNEISRRAKKKNKIKTRKD